MVNKEPVNRRRRPPISCLNCRRRKVKCDRQKPSCGGCVKNGVGHLCEYVEPPWASKEALEGSKLAQEKYSDHERYLEELRQLKSNNERTILNQKKEIEELKRQLSFNTQLSMGQSELNASSHIPIDVICKLNPWSLSSRDKLELEGHSNVSIKYNSNKPDTKVDLYSWISVIRLDPKLSSLWSKINNMQKLYYIYKQTNQLRITEVDFTSSKASTPSLNSPSINSPNSEAHKCPVVVCDLNFMSEKTPKQLKEEKALGFSPNNIPTSIISNQSLRNFATDGINFTKKLQELWTCVLRSSKGSKDLNSSQLSFILDYYFNDKNAQTSRYLTHLYKDHIYGAVGLEETELSFQLDTEDEPETNQFKKFQLSQVKGMYLVILVLIIDETLEILRLNIKNGVFNDKMLKFQNLFPEEVNYIHLPHKSAHRLTTVDEYLWFCFSSDDDSFIINRSVISLTCLVLMQKTLMSHTRENNELADATRLRSFKLLLYVVFNPNYQVDIWKDPSLIVSHDTELKTRMKDQRIQFCYLWNELIRFLNAFSFKLTKFYFYDNELEDLIKQAYLIIEEVQMNQNHIKYIQSLKTTEYDGLVVSLSTNYLLANINILLNKSVNNLVGLKLTIKDLDQLIGQCGSWIEDDRINTMTSAWKSETRILLHFSNIYLTYIMFLQCEESKNDDLKESLITNLFIKIDGFLKLTDSSLGLSIKEGQYLFVSLSELLVLLVQILVAVLLRVCHRQPSKNRALTKQLSSYYYTMSKSILDSDNNLNDLIKYQLSGFVTKTILKLNDVILVSKVQTKKLQKLWEFYLKILEEERKFDFNYSKLHANVPGFSKDLKAGTNFGNCPVAHMTGNTNPSTIKKCPVAHMVSDSPSPVNKCPIDHSQFTNLSKKSSLTNSPLQPAVKRMKTESPINNPNMELYPINAEEPMPNQAYPSTSNHMVFPVEETTSTEFNFGSHMNNFSNLDLNFLDDDSVFGPANGFNDINFNIENAFQ